MSLSCFHSVIIASPNVDLDCHVSIRQGIHTLCEDNHLPGIAVLFICLIRGPWTRLSCEAAEDEERSGQSVPTRDSSDSNRLDCPFLSAALLTNTREQPGRPSGTMIAEQQLLGGGHLVRNCQVQLSWFSRSRFHLGQLIRIARDKLLKWGQSVTTGQLHALHGPCVVFGRKTPVVLISETSLPRLR